MATAPSCCLVVANPAARLLLAKVYGPAFDFLVEELPLLRRCHNPLSHPQRSLMTAESELDRLEREIASASQSSPIPRLAQSERVIEKSRQPRNSFDLILAVAALLAIIGVGVNTVRQMPDQQAKTLRDGLIGGSAGLLVGYAIGRFRP